MLDHDLLNALPLELQLYIVEAVPVGERRDRAALALASPHLLAACREQLPSYQGLEIAIAFHLVLGGTIDEQLLRRYARRSEATPEGCDWLAGAAAEGVAVATSLQILVTVSSDAEPGECWHLTQTDSTAGTLLRRGKGGDTGHYEGEAGSEHLVCFETSGRAVAHFEGEKGAERAVRLYHPSGGDVSHFEGEKGAERMVRFEEENGNVAYYEGERGAERTVRLEQTSSGDVAHFEGERGAERQVRYEPSYGGLLHIKGERGAGRPTRYELPYGGVLHFGGVTNVNRPMRETDAGRVMRIYG